jgi:hypothetical protein
MNRYLHYRGIRSSKNRKITNPDPQSLAGDSLAKFRHLNENNLCLLNFLLLLFLHFLNIIFCYFFSLLLQILGNIVTVLRLAAFGTCFVLLPVCRLLHSGELVRNVVVLSYVGLYSS